MDNISWEVVRIIVLAFACFLVAFISTPTVVKLLRKYKMGKNIRDEKSAPIMSKMHAAKSGTPTMGGIVIWGSVLLVVGFIWLICAFWNVEPWCSWNILSRSQTFVPFGAMIAAALIGLLDDYLNIKKIGPKGGGLRVRHRLLAYTSIAAICAWWFYSKLDWSSIHIPFDGNLELSWFYIPVFIFIIVATQHSVNLTDGLDGLAGGTLMAAFGAYGAIAFMQGRLDLAALCAAIIGALLAFLWHNITPAAFFMGDTGAMALGTALGIIAMLTNQPLLLPIIGIPFVVESGSVIIQMASKKIRKGKKVFQSSPLHHHFEAIGWGEPKIVMRFWIVSFIFAVIGVLINLIDR
ncbi:MAG: phospho-N-acetylmuramoyl-pentapeptide-transferase [Patescibacteria group bacterium]|nr:phospho-N-acetylmuramoyl-pentapeptide-transferase [Patescibacteria group bacterium]